MAGEEASGSGGGDGSESGKGPADTTIPYSQAFLETLACVNRGDIPVDVKTIDDKPKPSAKPSKPKRAAPLKPWEKARQSASSAEAAQEQPASSADYTAAPTVPNAVVGGAQPQVLDGIREPAADAATAAPAASEADRVMD